MTPAESSLAEASVPLGMDAILDLTGAAPSQDVRPGTDQVSSSKAAQETQETPSKPQESKGDFQPISNYTAQTVTITDGTSNQTVPDGGNSQLMETNTRTRLPRAAAAAANANMAEQVKEEEVPLGVVIAKFYSGQNTAKTAAKAVGTAAAVLKKEKEEPIKQQPIAPIATSKRPSRAAAAAANAGMAQQAKEEEQPLSILVAAALVDQGEQQTKKRTTEGAEPAAKKSRTTSKVVQDTLEIAGAEQQQRGKKRRQAPVYEAAPIITDLPPLPFTTTSPDLRLKGKGKLKSVKGKTKENQLVEEIGGDDSRYCEFCKKVANICVMMHCRACRRVYHAGCFVHAFKPYLDANMPILDQVESLQLKAPDRRGNIFRCASCKAAFLDFYESGGYLWGCDCPTCTQPEKLIYYRQRKLVEMMNDMELEKQRKKEKKDKKKSDASNASASSGKPPVSTPSRSNSVSCSRRAPGRSATPDDQAIKSQPTRRSTSRSRGVSPLGQELKKGNDVAKAEAVNMLAGVGDTQDGLTEATKETKVEPMNVNDGGGPQMASDGLGTASREGDLENESEQLMNAEKLKNSTGLDDQAAVVEPAPTLADEEAAKQAAQIALTRLQALALFKRPKPRSDKSSIAARLPGAASLDFVAQVVCISPKYVMNMQNGSLVDRVVRSETPEPADSFPRKAGWMAFNRHKIMATARRVTCVCCEKSFSFDEFVGHTGISLNDLRKKEKKSRQVLYVVERQDGSALVPLNKFLPDMEIVASHGLDGFMDELCLPPPSPRPL